MLLPARQRKQRAGRQTFVVVGERLHGVQVAFRQRLHAGSRPAVGIERGHLDKIVLSRIAADESAGIAEVPAHARVLQPGARELQHVGVEFDGIDFTRIVIDRLEHFGAAAGAEDQDARVRNQAIRQR